MTTRSFADGRPWRKSSRSANQGGACVYVATFADGRRWRKSSRSAQQGGNCVYTSTSDSLIGIRDSKQGDDGPQLWISPTEWSALLNQLSPPTSLIARASH